MLPRVIISFLISIVTLYSLASWLIFGASSFRGS